MKLQVFDIFNLAFKKSFFVMTISTFCISRNILRFWIMTYWSTLLLFFVDCLPLKFIPMKNHWNLGRVVKTTTARNVIKFRHSFICQGTSTRRQRRGFSVFESSKCFSKAI